MKPPFDIAGDLDTPVSAFAKLEPFAPCFLLESVEGGERLGRYSFIGFGDRLHVRLDSEGLAVGESSGASAGQRAQLVRSPAPTSQAQLLSALRAALARAPQPAPALGQVPLAGGLVGYAAYDIVRYFERLPSLAAALRGAALAAGVRSRQPWHRAAARRQ